MKHRSLCTVLLFLLAPSFADGQPQDPQGQVAPVRIRLYNLAEVGSGEIKGGTSDAAEIFQLAGIKLDWTMCSGKAEDAPPQCAMPLGLGEIAVRLLRRPTDRKVEFAPNTGGVAIRATREGGGGYITVYYDRVEEIAERVRIRRKCVLGHALAHEIGHLLLPAGSHSQAGIMRERLSLEDWRAAEMGRLLFANRQAEAMRAGLGSKSPSPVSSAKSTQ